MILLLKHSSKLSQYDRILNHGTKQPAYE